MYKVTSFLSSNTVRTSHTETVQVVALTSWQPLAKVPRTFSLYDVAQHFELYF